MLSEPFHSFLYKRFSVSTSTIKYQRWNLFGTKQHKPHPERIIEYSRRFDQVNKNQNYTCVPAHCTLHTGTTIPVRWTEQWLCMCNFKWYLHDGVRGEGPNFVTGSNFVKNEPIGVVACGNQLIATMCSCTACTSSCMKLAQLGWKSRNMNQFDFSSNCPLQKAQALISDSLLEAS